MLVRSDWSDSRWLTAIGPTASDLTNLADSEPDVDALKELLLRAALQSPVGEGTVTFRSSDARVLTAEGMNAVNRILAAKGWRLWYARQMSAGPFCIWLHPYPMAMLSIWSSGPVRSAQIVYPPKDVTDIYAELNKGVVGEIWDDVVNALPVYVPKVPETGTVYMLMTTGAGGYTPRAVTNTGSDYVEDNYTPEVRRKWKLATESLSDPKVSARLVILNGPPGTGKTHLIRALLKDQKLSCLLVPNSLFPRLAEPALLTVFMEYCIQQRNNGRTPVLILEDGDDLLSPRSTHGDRSNNPLSTLLNMSDGILGQALEVRIVITTNKQDQEFDAAIMRAGRLSQHIHVGALTQGIARDILKRLNVPTTHIDGWYSSTATLAEVYDYARRYGGAL